MVRLLFLSIQIIPIAPYTLVAFLPAQAGFHPKRNQARERLATLRAPRLQDLTSDVCHELGRRYPACKGEVMSLPFRRFKTFLILFAAL